MNVFLQTGKKRSCFLKRNTLRTLWDTQRRVIIKAEHLEKGGTPRFVGTSISGAADEVYHKWLPNQFRILLSTLAYTLVQAIRAKALAKTELARARCDTIRLKLLKIGAAVVRNTRRVILMLSECYPYKQLFRLVAARLKAG
jgi:hypothetical protein